LLIHLFFLKDSPDGDAIRSIKVDLDFPERNQDFIINRVVGVIKDGRQFDVIHIMLKHSDYDDFLADHYEAILIAPNVVVVKKPYQSHSYLNGFDAFFQKQKDEPGSTPNYCSKMQDAHSIHWNDLKKDPQCNVERVALIFPNDMRLSNRHYGASTGENVLFADYGDYGMPTSIAAPPGDIADIMEVDRTKDVVFWKISVMGPSDRVVAMDNMTQGQKLMAARTAGKNQYMHH
jgi:hypothetical protein